MNTVIDDADGLSAFSKDSLANHIKTLASDDFQGRKPFTGGETKTINYIKQEFMNAGLEPGNGSSYFQDVPMVNITATADSTMKVSAATGDFNLNGPGDYIAYTDKTDSTISFNNDEVVFAGYGVVAPEYNWNDYARLDVKGKIVLVLVNDPGFNANDTSLFKGRAMTWYGRWPYKYAEAAKQGAKGCFIIHSDAAATYPFKVVQNLWNTSRLRLDMRGKTEKLCDINGWISTEATKKLLTAAGKDSTLLAKADKRGFVAEPLNIRFSTTIHVKSEYNKSHNVIGKITGTKYPDETIIYSAHWDHLGIGKPDEKGDSIYNGAVDNATGVGGLLELARAFKSLKNQPERTIVFLSVTAEEQGLWGSDYYAQNPVYPIDKTVANLNMDMLNTWGKTKDIGMVGEGQNELEDYLKEEATKVNRYVTHDMTPETGSYYRSDHFNFAKVGVPSLDLKYGIDVLGKGREYGAASIAEYKKNIYHRPSDEYNETVVLDGTIADIELLFRIGRRLSFDHKWPVWKEGSEFKAIREKK
ncbi:MAG: M28 family metallopeptidase [Ferruginibacter sp.]